MGVSYNLIAIESLKTTDSQSKKSSLAATGGFSRELSSTTIPTSYPSLSPPVKIQNFHQDILGDKKMDTCKSDDCRDCRDCVDTGKCINCDDQYIQNSIIYNKGESIPMLAIHSRALKKNPSKVNPNVTAFLNDKEKISKSYIDLETYKTTPMNFSCLTGSFNLLNLHHQTLQNLLKITSQTSMQFSSISLNNAREERTYEDFLRVLSDTNYHENNHYNNNINLILVDSSFNTLYDKFLTLLTFSSSQSSDLSLNSLIISSFLSMCDELIIQNIEKEKIQLIFKHFDSLSSETGISLSNYKNHSTLLHDILYKDFLVRFQYINRIVDFFKQQDNQFEYTWSKKITNTFQKNNFIDTLNLFKKNLTFIGNYVYKADKFSKEDQIPNNIKSLEKNIEILITESNKVWKIIREYVLEINKLLNDMNEPLRKNPNHLLTDQYHSINCIKNNQCYCQNYVTTEINSIHLMFKHLFKKETDDKNYETIINNFSEQKIVKIIHNISILTFFFRLKKVLKQLEYDIFGNQQSDNKNSFFHSFFQQANKNAYDYFQNKRFSGAIAQENIKNFILFSNALYEKKEIIIHHMIREAFNRIIPHISNEQIYKDILQSNVFFKTKHDIDASSELTSIFTDITINKGDNDENIIAKYKEKCHSLLNQPEKQSTQEINPFFYLSISESKSLDGHWPLDESKCFFGLLPEGFFMEIAQSLSIDIKEIETILNYTWRKSHFKKKWYKYFMEQVIIHSLDYVHFMKNVILSFPEYFKKEHEIIKDKHQIIPMPIKNLVPLINQLLPLSNIINDSLINFFFLQNLDIKIFQEFDKENFKKIIDKFLKDKKEDSIDKIINTISNETINKMYVIIESLHMFLKNIYDKSGIDKKQDHLIDIKDIQDITKVSSVTFIKNKVENLKNYYFFSKELNPTSKLFQNIKQYNSQVEQKIYDYWDKKWKNILSLIDFKKQKSNPKSSIEHGINIIIFYFCQSFVLSLSQFIEKPELYSQKIFGTVFDKDYLNFYQMFDMKLLQNNGLISQLFKAYHTELFISTKKYQEELSIFSRIFSKNPAYGNHSSINHSKNFYQTLNYFAKITLKAEIFHKLSLTNGINLKFIETHDEITMYSEEPFLEFTKKLSNNGVIRYYRPNNSLMTYQWDNPTMFMKTLQNSSQKFFKLKWIEDYFHPLITAIKQSYKFSDIQHNPQLNQSLAQLKLCLLYYEEQKYEKYQQKVEDILEIQLKKQINKVLNLDAHRYHSANKKTIYQTEMMEKQITTTNLFIQSRKIYYSEDFSFDDLYGSFWNSFFFFKTDITNQYKNILNQRIEKTNKKIFCETRVWNKILALFFENASKAYDQYTTSGPYTNNIYYHEKINVALKSINSTMDNFIPFQSMNIFNSFDKINNTLKTITDLNNQSMKEFLRKFKLMAPSKDIIGDYFHHDRLAIFKYAESKNALISLTKYKRIIEDILLYSKFNEYLGYLHEDQNFDFTPYFDQSFLDFDSLKERDGFLNILLKNYNNFNEYILSLHGYILKPSYMHFFYRSLKWDLLRFKSLQTSFTGFNKNDKIYIYLNCLVILSKIETDIFVILDNYVTYLNQKEKLIKCNCTEIRDDKLSQYYSKYIAGIRINDENVDFNSNNSSFFNMIDVIITFYFGNINSTLKSDEEYFKNPYNFSYNKIQFGLGSDIVQKSNVILECFNGNKSFEFEKIFNNKQVNIHHGIQMWYNKVINPSDIYSFNYRLSEKALEHFQHIEEKGAATSGFKTDLQAQSISTQEDKDIYKETQAAVEQLLITMID